jgi:anthranilate synthase/aminodeoxychorismate synthase-like glutamine amidotransferase
MNVRNHKARAPRHLSGSGSGSFTGAVYGSGNHGPRLLLVDNYDSFTFNLVQLLGELDARIEVFRNDQIDVDGIRRHRPDGLVLSPGPCTPDEAGVSLAAVAALAGELPVLGVCLGHQTVGQAFGGKVIRNSRIVHGKSSPVHHHGQGIYAGLALPFEAGRYHSLVVERESLPACLVVTSWTAEGEIMGVRHRTLDVEGVQFHPESILTPQGRLLLANWLKGIRAKRPAAGAHAASREAHP